MELANLRRLDPSTRVLLYTLDATPITPAATPIYFQDASRSPVVFQGTEYRPWPIEVRGFARTSRGQLPRPTLRISNVFANEIGELADAYDDLIGARLTRLVTFERYLDGQAGADPLAVFERDLYLVERLVSRTLSLLEFELVCALDVEGVRIPRRIVAPNFCSWEYRSEECGWDGSAPWYDATNEQVGDQQLDVCSRDLAGCRLRWGRSGAGAILRAGLFPGTELVKR